MAMTSNPSLHRTASPSDELPRRPNMEPSEFYPRLVEVHAHDTVISTLRAAEFHWHFSQGFRALQEGLYVPGSLALLTGIEASIRMTLYRLNSDKFPFDGDLGPVLSNSLLRLAREHGLPVEALAFPDETDFLATLGTRRPEVRIVQIRNDLAHGNIQRYVNRDLGDEIAFFTPECLRRVAESLQVVSMRWAEELARFRSAAQLER